MSEFENRLRKVAAHRRRWARRQGLTAYRVYDRDIPAYRHVVDVYGDHVHVVEYSGGRVPRTEEVLAAIEAVLGVPRERIHLKLKERKAPGAQYRAGPPAERRVVVENGLSFLVDLESRIDTGLFLDHRDTRARVRAEAAGKRFLNLFCYTGSFTVYAAAGGADATTSVDLSSTYLAWAEDNLRLNGLWDGRHELVRADVLRWVRETRKGSFDLAVLDPPSFSVSKAMASDLDIQRDHARLVEDTLALLARGGVLYFSTNLRDFRLDPHLAAEELTPGSLPQDVRDTRTHRLFRLVRGGD